MPDCDRQFDEALFSGYLDGELTQADAQRVRLHLAECATCRLMVKEMDEIREATMTTRFETPADDQWDERARGLGSRWARRLGWGLGIASLATAAAVGLWMFAVEPSHWGEKALFGGLTGGFLLLFVSILLDRLRTLKTDRYRRVEK